MSTHGWMGRTRSTRWVCFCWMRRSSPTAPAWMRIGMYYVRILYRTTIWVVIASALTVALVCRTVLMVLTLRGIVGTTACRPLSFVHRFLTLFFAETICCCCGESLYLT